MMSPASDAYCVTCHATKVGGTPVADATCQSCYGPGSLYLKPHQEKDAFKTRFPSFVQQGMRDIIGKPATWVLERLKCHVLDHAEEGRGDHRGGTPGRQRLRRERQAEDDQRQPGSLGIGGHEGQAASLRRRGDSGDRRAAQGNSDRTLEDG